MPIVRVALEGDGTLADPYRVPLPNYTDFSWDYVELTAIVSVPSRDMAIPLPANGSADRPLIGGMYVIIHLDESATAAWHALLASRYPTQDPPFLPEAT
jgi:hypothetical protein